MRTRLRGPDEAYVRCRACGKTVIGKVGDEFCRPCDATTAALMKPLQVRCPHCQVVHLGSRGRRYCSRECFAAHRADEALEMAEAFAANLDLGAATGWRHRLFRFLTDRDGTACYLCGEDVDLDERDDRMGPSVDHIQPRSKGGTHDLDNTALVHRRCNSRKGNRSLDEYRARWGGPGA